MAEKRWDAHDCNINKEHNPRIIRSEMHISCVRFLLLYLFPRFLSFFRVAAPAEIG